MDQDDWLRPVRIVEEIVSLLTLRGGFLNNKKVVVTAGGTREPIDPVRYIGNRSSGKMGYAIARLAARMGAKRCANIWAGFRYRPPPGVRRIDVETASAMREAVLSEYEDCDIVIKAAAVADYRPKQVALQKIKKTDENIPSRIRKEP